MESGPTSRNGGQRCLTLTQEIFPSGRRATVFQKRFYQASLVPVINLEHDGRCASGGRAGKFPAVLPVVMADRTCATRSRETAHFRHWSPLVLLQRDGA